MGCDSYTASLRLLSGWAKANIMFSEDDDVACLCTFPHNNDGKMWRPNVESLAMLGAAVVLAHHGNLGSPEGYIYLPGDLPEWISEGINEWLRDEPVEAGH